MVNSTNRWHTAAYLFLALLFSGNSSLIARKLKILISTRRILIGFSCCFFFSSSTWKSVQKMAAFGRVLVLVVAFSFQNSTWKNVETWTFLSIWSILGFGCCCFFQSLFEEVLKNKNNLSFWSNLGFGVAFFPKTNINRATVNSTNRWHTAAYLFLALLFPWKSSLRISTRIILVLVVAFSFQNSTWKSVEKMAPFGRILVLAVYFFLLKFYLKKCWKIRFCSLWSNCGFGVAFSPKIISSGRWWTAQTDGIPRHTCSWHCFSLKNPV